MCSYYNETQAQPGSVLTIINGMRRNSGAFLWGSFLSHYGSLMQRSDFFAGSFATPAGSSEARAELWYPAHYLRVNSARVYWLCVRALQTTERSWQVSRPVVLLFWYLRVSGKFCLNRCIQRTTTIVNQQCHFWLKYLAHAVRMQNRTMSLHW